MAWLLYQGAIAIALVVAAPYFLARRARHYLSTFGSRLGRYPAVELRPRLWIHAVSVGEVKVAQTLVSQLPPAIPIVLTTVTATGRDLAQRLFAGRAEVAVLPFDLGGPIGRFHRRYSPRALILIEGDYWPLVLREAQRREVPVAVVNGRVGDRGFGRLRRCRPLLHLLFGPVGRFGVQTRLDLERLVELGVDADRITVTGNLKFDGPPPAALPELEASIHALAAGRAVIVAGSTMPGEEGLVLDAIAAVGHDRAFLILAPRHPERCDEAEDLTRQRRMSATRRSRLDPAPGRADRVDVCILDTLGELASIYRLARGAFIGGTLVPTGGHNPLEPARCGIPVVAGPSMHNFAEISAALDAGGAWTRVRDAAGLAAVWMGWVEDPEAAQALGKLGGEVVAANRGATARSIELIQPLLEKVHAALG